MKATATVDVEEDTAGEKFEHGGAGEELDDRDGGEADVELQPDDGDAPQSEEPGGGAFGDEEEKEKEDEIEVKLVAEGPALQKNHLEVGGDKEVGGKEVMERVDLGAGGVLSGGEGIEMAGDEGDGGVDPEDGEDAREAMVEEDACVGGLGESSGCDRGDDDAADDEEQIDTESAVLQERQAIGGKVFCFDAVEMSEHDKEGGESATDLNADDPFRLLSG